MTQGLDCQNLHHLNQSGIIRRRESGQMSYAIGRLLRGNLFWIVLLVVLLVFAAPIISLSIPKPVPRPIEGNYDYQPAPLVTSTYRIHYGIPNPVNVTQLNVLSVFFNVSSLVGQTNSVEVHTLNVTITTAQGKRLFSQVVSDNRILKQGELWGPKQVPFAIDNATLQLAPGSDVKGRVMLSVSFDERADIPLQGTKNYPKLAVVPVQEIVIRSPTVVVRSAFQFDLYQSLVTGALVGGLVYVVASVADVFLGLPRPTLGGSVFRDPKTGQFVGRLAAFRAFLSVGFAFIFVVLANLGAAQNQINLMKVVTDIFLGRQDLEALVAVGLWIAGILRFR